ncbi:PAS domain-containing protein [Pedobacter sp. JY14-1]|uniref:PAS domain-containing protein n=1 Tax=Pedobacter sp. JY14-1 TaxID=3034151 RepID=UPI0023E220D7|nr:PAS domain-containing protein [Pedobacter sp. JY14-1]
MAVRLSRPYLTMPERSGITKEMLRFFESLPQKCLIISPELRILSASAPYLELTGKSMDSIRGAEVFDVFPVSAPWAPEQSGGIAESLAKVLATGKPDALPVMRFDVPDPENPDGLQERYWKSANTPVLNDDGSIWYIIHQTEDVSEQVISEQQLRRSLEKEKLLNAQQQRLFEEIPAQIAIVSGPDFVYEYINPQYQAELFPNRDVLGMPLLEAVPEVSGQPILDVLKHVYLTGETHTEKEICVPLAPVTGGELKDHYFDVSYQPLRNINGEIYAVLSFKYEVTTVVAARKELEHSRLELIGLNNELAQANEEIQASNEELSATNEELFSTQEELRKTNVELEGRVLARTAELSIAQEHARAQAERLRMLFMQAPAGICILYGPELVFELANPLYEQFFVGRELLGKPIFKALPELENTQVHDILRNVYEKNEVYEGNELPVMLSRTPDGPLEQRYFTFIYQPRHDLDGTVNGIMVFALEVTEAVLARQRETDRRKEIDQKKDEFISIASHELKTPLTGIKGFNQLMARTDDLQKQQAYIRKSAEQIGRLEKLIHDLLDVTKITSGKILYNMAPFSFLKMLRDSIENAQQATDRHRIELEAAGDVQYPGDAARLEQVMNNLLSNAIKYSPSADRIYVRYRCDEKGITVAVQDFGVGIEAPQRHLLFDRYYRADHTAMRFEGLGLGLYISSEIISRHQGKLWVESEMGQGAVFYFWLPL